MKFLKIAVFLFCFQIALAMLNYSDQYTANEMAIADEWMEDVTAEEVKKDSFVQNLFGEGIADAIATMTGYIRGLSMFIKVLAGAIVVFPKTLISLGIDSTIAVLVSLPVYLIYLVAILQFISKNQMEGMT